MKTEQQYENIGALKITVTKYSKMLVRIIVIII